jgi:hypothetical protein
MDELNQMVEEEIKQNTKWKQNINLKK